MNSSFTRHDSRIPAGIAAIVVQALLAFALIAGLHVTMPARVHDTLSLFGILPEPPPPPPVAKPIPHEMHRPHAGAAAPPNLKSKATEVVAPPVIAPTPPPVVTAQVASVGMQASSGAALVAGPGTGAGGRGTGTGSGGAGDGDGDGDTPPRQRSGKIKDSDYPHEAGVAGLGGTVSVRYSVETNGRVGTCRVTHSSGNAALDETTCRLIQQRFRFEPSRDAHGVAVASILVEDHIWSVQHDDTDQ